MTIWSKYKWHLTFLVGWTVLCWTFYCWICNIINMAKDIHIFTHSKWQKSKSLWQMCIISNGNQNNLMFISVKALWQQTKIFSKWSSFRFIISCKTFSITFRFYVNFRSCVRVFVCRVRQWIVNTHMVDIYEYMSASFRDFNNA